MSGAYGASTARRQRSTRSEMTSLHDSLFEIAERLRPLTVRGLFYQAEIAGLIPKTERGYRRVQRATVEMRRAGRLPYAWLTDGTRLRQRPRTWRNAGEAARATAQFYRRTLWGAGSPSIELWVEKEALSGVLWPVADEWDVPLYPARGYSSLTFLHGAAEELRTAGRPAFIYHLGDHDPSGVDAAHKIERELRRLAPEVPIHFERLAVLPEQIQRWNLPTRPTKASDPRSRSWEGESVELDAIPAPDLRKLAEAAILRHIDLRALDAAMVAEASESELLEVWAEQFDRTLGELGGGA